MFHQLIPILLTSRLKFLLILVINAQLQHTVQEDQFQNKNIFKNETAKSFLNNVTLNQHSSMPFTTNSNNQFFVNKYEENFNNFFYEDKNDESKLKNTNVFSNNSINKFNLNKKTIDEELFLNSTKFKKNNFNEHIGKVELNNIQISRPIFYKRNKRLKTRHVTSGDQLRILRKEGQPLRLSCLPAFHAPSRSTVSWYKNGSLIKFTEQAMSQHFKWSLQLKLLKPEDSGVYECVVQNSLGRTSLLYRLKVLPAFKNENLNEKFNYNIEKNLTTNRSKKSLTNINSINNSVNQTILSFKNITLDKLGEKATLRCVINGYLAQPHFKWFFKINSEKYEDLKKRKYYERTKELSFDNHSVSIDFSNQLYQTDVILIVNSKTYQSLEEKNYGHLNGNNQNLYYQHKSMNQPFSYFLQSIFNQLSFISLPNVNNIENMKIFLPDGAYSYASELTIQTDPNSETELGEYLCVNFGTSIHYQSAFLKLKDKDFEKPKVQKFRDKFFTQIFKKSSKFLQKENVLNENISKKDNSNLEYSWFNDNNLNSDIKKHESNNINELNYIHKDKIKNDKIIAEALVADEFSKFKEDNENLFLIIVPLTFGILIAILLVSLINYLKKRRNEPDIPDLTDQCLIVQQIKSNDNNEKQNLIMNPLADENLDINYILNSTTKLADSSLDTKNENNLNLSIAQLNEIYHPVVKGPHSHLLIKPSNLNCCNTLLIHNNSNLANQNELINQPISLKQNSSINTKTIICTNKTEKEIITPNCTFQNEMFNQNWSVNCCDTCPCTQTHHHKTPG